MSWSVKPGDRVQQFEQVCEVQSDKASVEITSRYDGIIKKLHYDVDDMAIVGQPLLDIEIDNIVDEEVEQLDDTQIRRGENGSLKEDEAQEVIKEDIKIGAGSQQPEILLGAERERDGPPEDPQPPQQIPSLPKQPAILTPAVRHMVKSLGLDVSKIQGTGKDGRILKEDVQRHSSTASSLPVTSTIPTPKDSPDDRSVCLTATEKQMFKVMTSSLSIPHFLYTHPVDLTSLNSLRQKINSVSPTLPEFSQSTPKLTSLPFIMKALSQAFLTTPKLNSHLYTDNDTSKLLIKASHNFGIAVDTPQGLLVPVVRDVQNHSVTSLATEINRLSKLAKEGKLQVANFKDATFIISNIGSIGGGVVKPIIVSPMVGILGVGRAQDRLVSEKDLEGEDRFVKREEVVLSWSADHRILDGATVARCAEIVTRHLENFEAFSAIFK
ncbi:hypothetical protein ACEPPN_013169 [Leptodophora sp. 'Broadleaf-Isolate-01']